jgi:NAD(P)-dependent dehydrogenase (short-subunit alcohol dehydrogenase family)
MTKKRVFITGATGHMGWATLQEFMGRLDRFDVTVLARDSKKNRQLLAPVQD